MYIKSVELINIRSYKEEKLELSKGINILTGCNNSGKSTIIKAAYTLQQRAVLKSDDIRKGYTYSRIFIELEDIDKKDQKLFKLKDGSIPYFSTFTQFLILSNYSGKGLSSEAYHYDPLLKSKRLKNHVVEVYDESGVKKELSGLSEFPQKENENNFIYPFLAKRKTEYFESTGSKEDTFGVSENFRNLASKIQKLSNASHPQNKHFVKLCQEILGFQIGTIPAENNSGFNIGVYSSNTEYISIQSMGDGVANIVGLIVTLLTEDRKLYLVEEIENDIHPEALKKLLNLIIEKSENNQFIISTHSNIVLKYLGSKDDSRIFYVENSETMENSHKVFLSKVSQIQNTPSERIEILKKLGYDFFDFELYEGYLILEESSAERIIRDLLIPHFVPELKNKVKTIASNGVDGITPRVEDFLRLFVFIHTNEIYYKKAWVIADGDDPGMKVINDLKIKFSTWPENHFLNFTEENFEFYYPSRFRDKALDALNLSKQEKRSAKEALLKEVLNWINVERETAIKEFEVSAKEVIEQLKNIAKQIRG